MKFLTLIFFLFSAFNLIKAQTITHIEFLGLTKTNPIYLESIIECKSGMPFDSLKVLYDVQTIKNLNLFFNVEYKIVQDSLNQNTSIIFMIYEANYIYPMLTVSGFKDVIKIQAGINQINWKGENKTIGFTYQYYDRHSISMYQKTPRYKNSKFGHFISLSKYSTVEPLYFNATKSDFYFDNYNMSTALIYWLNKKINLEIGGMLMHETYLQKDTVTLDLPKMKFSFLKFQVRSALTYNWVNYHYERLNGLYFQLYSELIETKNYPTASFLKFNSTLKYFKTINKKGNLALQYTFGVATNNNSPFSPFVIDGFLNIRGVGNRIERGTAQNVINIEYRQTLVNKKYFTIQALLFNDLGALRQPGKSLTELAILNNYYNNSGIGIRFHSKFFYKTIFRLDYGINLLNHSQNGFSFGFGQFF